MNRSFAYASIVLTLSISVTLPCLAYAQSAYPNKPIRMIISTAAGPGTPDIVGRISARGIEEQLKATVIVDNRAGANGNIAHAFVAKAVPDGYTLLFHTSGLILSPWLYKDPGYDAINDFSAITLVYTSPFIYAVNPMVPIKTMQEFVDYVKRNPNKLTFGSTGVGNTTHLIPMLLLRHFNLDAVHVPYKSSATLITDLVAGRIDMYSSTPTSLGPFIKDGKIRPLAVAALTRVPSMPELPTVSETVIPGFEAGSWGGLQAPAKTSPIIVNRLQTALEKHFSSSPGLTAKFDAMAAIPVLNKPDEFASYVKSELARWGKVIKDAGIVGE